MTMTREEWLAARKRGIGATDAVAVCGLSPWRDALAVYCDKLSLVEPDAPTEEMEFGILAEPLVAQLYEKRTGLALVEPAERLVGRRDEPWAICSPDRFRKSDGRLVEIKTANPFRARDWGEEGTDAVPDHYAAQVVWQMFVLEVDVVDLAVLLGRKLLIYTLRRDDRAVIDGLSFEAWMRERCRAFWFENVLAQVAPTERGCFPMLGCSQRLCLKPVRRPSLRLLRLGVWCAVHFVRLHSRHPAYREPLFPPLAQSA